MLVLGNYKFYLYSDTFFPIRTMFKYNITTKNSKNIAFFYYIRGCSETFLSRSLKVQMREVWGREEGWLGW